MQKKDSERKRNFKAFFTAPPELLGDIVVACLLTRLIARSDGSLLPVFSCYMGYFFKKVVKKIWYPDGGFLVTLLGLFDDRCSFQCGRAGFWLKYVLTRDLPGVALLITFFMKLFTVHRKV